MAGRLASLLSQGFSFCIRMDQGNKSRAAPPPLPDPSAVRGADIEPPPLVDSAPAEEPQPPADPVEEFLTRAAPVLALERGMNARSRVKLAAIADELGLSDEQFDQVMEKLLSGESTARRQVSREEMRKVRRRKRAFHNQVGETLMALPHGVLTSGMEQKLVEDGVEQHGLSQEDARADILKLARQLRIRRITHDEAQRHIAELTDKAIAGNGTLRSDVRKRILAEGSRWGLTPDQVEPILRERISHVRMGERKEQMRMVALVSLSAAVLVGVLGMIAWMAFTQSLPDPAAVATVEVDGAEPGDTAPPTVTGEGKPSPAAGVAPPRKLGVPAWWNDELASFIANVRLRLPFLEDELYQLRSPDPQTRGKAYQELMVAAGRGDLGFSDRDVLAGLFAAAYAVEPADECARQLRQAWIDSPSRRRKSFPRTCNPTNGRFGFPKWQMRPWCKAN